MAEGIIYTKSNIKLNVFETISYHLEHRDKVCPVDLSNEIVDSLGRMQVSGEELAASGQGFKLVVDRDNDRFSCYQGDIHAGYISFEQLNQLTLTRLRQLPDGHDMGSLDLNALTPTPMNIAPTKEDLS